MLNQRIFQIAYGYEDANCQSLRHEPTPGHRPAGQEIVSILKRVVGAIRRQRHEVADVSS